MTTYCVRKTGNDGSAGTSPATAWLTIGKALGAAGISSGDTVYIGAGVYREGVTCNLISPAAETFIIGDCDGSYTGDAGEVRITNYLTDDKTAPTDQRLLDLNGTRNLTFINIMFHAGYGTSAVNTGEAVGSSTTFPTYITFSNCAFNILSTGGAIADVIMLLGEADTPAHWLIDRCRFFIVGVGIASVGLLYQFGADSSADFDADFVIQNCFIFGQGYVDFSGKTGIPGGVVIRNCTIWSQDMTLSVTNGSTTYPCQVINSIIMGYPSSSAAFKSNTLGAIIEDYNWVGQYPNPYQNTTPGANTISDASMALLLHFGQELQQGLSLRPFGMPTADSPLLGFGDDGNAPSVDILNRPRPAGGQSILKAVGAYERHDTAVKETTVFDVTPGIKIVGPGDHEFQIPVDATATTISVKARYDANHAATNKPQAILLAAPEIGVTAETKTMTAAVNTWETLTFTQFTPTTSGVVVARLVSRSAADNGIAYFDTFNIS